jgi:hypothetical protein
VKNFLGSCGPAMALLVFFTTMIVLLIGGMAWLNDECERERTKVYEVTELQHEMAFETLGKPFVNSDGLTVQCYAPVGSCSVRILRPDGRVLPKRFMVSRWAGTTEPAVVSLED